MAQENIRAQMSRLETALLFDLVSALQPERMIEIGAGQGGSAQIIVAAMDLVGCGKLVSVEKCPQLPSIDWQGISHRAELLIGSSPQDLPKAYALLGNKDLELCLIDGDHTYSGVLADILGILPLMAAESYLLFHDAFCDQIKEAIDDALALVNDLIDCGILNRKDKNMDPDGETFWVGLRLIRIIRKYSHSECERFRNQIDKESRSKT